MRVRNVHHRRIAAPPGEVGPLIDALAGPGDRLWPSGRWPAMVLDRPLGVGAEGGHAFIRYRVEAHHPSQAVVFEFTGPDWLTGTHSFEAATDGDGTRLTHTIEGAVAARFAPLWLTVVRPLHDALIEDALDRAETETAGPPASPARWSRWVRFLRRRVARAG